MTVMTAVFGEYWVTVFVLDGRHLTHHRSLVHTFRVGVSLPPVLLFPSRPPPPRPLHSPSRPPLPPSPLLLARLNQDGEGPQAWD